MLIDYLPYFMQDIREVEKVMNISQPGVDNLQLDTENLLNDFFVIGSSEEATKHYEKILDIIPKLTDSLEKRQYDILVLYNQTLPFTLESLQQKLTAICGEDGYILNMFYEKFTLDIKLQLDRKHLFFTVSNLLEWIVPVNIVLELYVNYNIWSDLSKYKWGEVKTYKWSEIKENEEIRNKV